ncbi:hypothetical protein [Streptomyces sp. NPDC002537]
MRNLVLGLLIATGLLYPFLVHAFARRNPRAQRIAVFTVVGSLLLALLAWDRW